MAGGTDENEVCWYAMRDLSRPHSRTPAYKLLTEEKVTFFTPMTKKTSVRRGKRIISEVPFIHDLIFIHDCSKNIDILLHKLKRLQYRFQKGFKNKRIIVPEEEMTSFLEFVNSSPSSQYISSDEITPNMIGAHVKILKGELAGYEGNLLAIKGSKKKRLLVQLPQLLAAAVEIDSDSFEIIDTNHKS